MVIFQNLYQWPVRNPPMVRQRSVMSLSLINLISVHHPVTDCLSVSLLLLFVVVSSRRPPASPSWFSRPDSALTHSHTKSFTAAQWCQLVSGSHCCILRSFWLVPHVPAFTGPCVFYLVPTHYWFLLLPVNSNRFPLTPDFYLAQLDAASSNCLQ